MGRIGTLVLMYSRRNVILYYDVTAFSSKVYNNNNGNTSDTFNTERVYTRK